MLAAPAFAKLPRRASARISTGRSIPAVILIELVRCKRGRESPEHIAFIHIEPLPKLVADNRPITQHFP
jgi:hypothetical protein